jgi:hypothetical protein
MIAGSCPCGEARIEVRGLALTRFLCHCRICQQLYDAPHADVTCFRSTSIGVTTPGNLRFRRYRAPPALRRGTCSHCGAPLVGYMTLLPLVRIAFVPTRSLDGIADLPEPRAHIFYHRRMADAADGLPRVAGHWPSELAVTGWVLGGLASALARERAPGPP